MKKTLPHLVFALIFVPGVAVADWIKQLDINYVMGDGENRIGARQAAIEQLKSKASHQVGTYIQSTTSLRDGKLTENIQVLSASLVKVSNVSEKLSINQAGQGVLSLVATITVDEKELARRIELLQMDSAKANQIERLRADNLELRNTLTQIRAQLTQEPDPATAARLLSMQDDALKHIDKNGKAVSQIFERGTLIQMATSNSVALDAAKQSLEDSFFVPVMSSPVSAVIQSVQADGDGYVSKVRLTWDINEKALYPVLVRYFQSDNTTGLISINKFYNTDTKGPHPLSEQLYQYLTWQGIDLRVTLGHKEVRVPVFYADDSFMTPCSDYRRNHMSATRLCLVTKSGSDKSPRWMDDNSLLRVHLTKEEAASATTIDAVFVKSSIGEHKQ